jgi:alanine racemase
VQLWESARTPGSTLWIPATCSTACCPAVAQIARHGCGTHCFVSPAVSLQVKGVDRQEFASESPVVQEAPARIGVIPMGIADGLRALSCGEVLVRGRRCRLVGNLSLEHARVDLSDVLDAERGDEVVVVGTQGDQEITPAEVERANGLASSGLVLAAGASVQRVYLGNEALLPS